MLEQTISAWFSRLYGFFNKMIWNPPNKAKNRPADDILHRAFTVKVQSPLILISGLSFILLINDSFSDQFSGEVGKFLWWFMPRDITKTLHKITDTSNINVQAVIVLPTNKKQF